MAQRSFWAFNSGIIIPFKVLLFFKAKVAGNTPVTGWISPPNETSPNMAYLSRLSLLICPEAAK